MPGKPTGLGHYEFIQELFHQRLTKTTTTSGWLSYTRMPTSRRVSQEPSDGRLAEFCAAPSKPLWDPQDKTSPIATRRSLTAKHLFCRPSIATCGGAGLPALIPSRANPRYVRVSAKPTGIAVGLSAEDALTWQY
jgi:hypothetical protein